MVVVWSVSDGGGGGGGGGQVDTGATPSSAPTLTSASHRLQVVLLSSAQHLLARSSAPLYQEQKYRSIFECSHARLLPFELSEDLCVGRLVLLWN